MLMILFSISPPWMLHHEWLASLHLSDAIASLLAAWKLLQGKHILLCFCHTLRCQVLCLLQLLPSWLLSALFLTTACCCNAATGLFLLIQQLSFSPILQLLHNICQHYHSIACCALIVAYQKYSFSPVSLLHRHWLSHVSLLHRHWLYFVNCQLYRSIVCITATAAMAPLHCCCY